MKITDLVPEHSMKFLPLTFWYFKPLDRSKYILVNRLIAIEKFQSYNCNNYPPTKPISKIL